MVLWEGGRSISVRSIRLAQTRTYSHHPYSKRGGGSYNHRLHVGPRRSKQLTHAVRDCRTELPIDLSDIFAGSNHISLRYPAYVGPSVDDR
jgi:hypothetical protein